MPGVAVLILDVADVDPGFEQVRPVVAVQTLPSQATVERLDVAVVPTAARRDVRHPALPAQNACSAWEMSADPLPIRSTLGGPPPRSTPTARG